MARVQITKARGARIRAKSVRGDLAGVSFQGGDLYADFDLDDGRRVSLMLCDRDKASSLLMAFYERLGVLLGEKRFQ